MKTLLAIHSSGRSTRSVTRHLSEHFVATWRGQDSDANVVVRDIGLSSPSPVNETWIKAAFGELKGPAEELAESEELIEEIITADAIVLGVPMYNFGLPAQAKAYFDQVTRVGRTFDYDPEAAAPFRPLLSSKPCTVITSVSDPDLYPGGTQFHLNCLEPHLDTLWRFIGIRDLDLIRAEEGLLEDTPGLARAEAEVDRAAERAWAVASRRAITTG